MASSAPENDAECLEWARQEFERLLALPNYTRVAAKVRAISACPTRLVCELLIEPEHANSKGTLHGGFSATLTDIVTSRAIGITSRRQGRASLELSVSYLLPVKVGERVTLIANVLQVDDSLAFAELDVMREDGKLAVKGKHTMAIFPMK